MLDNNFKTGQTNKTLFLRKTSTHLLISKIYVDDIVFRATPNSLSHEITKEMKCEFEISMIGKLNFFFCIQIK